MNRPASIAQLQEARRILGPVGVRPFRTYVQKTYGPLSEEVARLFLRTPGGEQAALMGMAQVFAPAPQSKGKVVSSRERICNSSTNASSSGDSLARRSNFSSAVMHRRRSTSERD